MADFVNDRNCWYFGPMSRQDATDLLMNERESGVFLVRDSNTIIGDYVLCVREDTKVSHYIINKIQTQSDQNLYRIGDQQFCDLPELLNFYKFHFLDTTPLKRPAIRKLERVIGKFDFDGKDEDDLPFRRGEILTIISKDEEQWWTAKNSEGQIGQIPVPYVSKYEENGQRNSNNTERPGSGGSGGNNTTNRIGSSITSSPNQVGNSLKKSDLNRKLPALARVKQARVPNAYDKTALRLELGDIIEVTKTNINGQWEGTLNGKKGHFPFTHVEFIEENNDEFGINSNLNSITTNNSASQQQQLLSPGNKESTLNNSCNKIGGQQIVISNNEWGD